MSVDAGKKVVVQVNMTSRLLEAIDAIAERERTADDVRPNRSRAIRHLVEDGIRQRATGGAATPLGESGPPPRA